MVLRVTFRLAWSPQSITFQQPSRAASYPAAVLTQGTFVGALGAQEAAAGVASAADRALGGQNQPSLSGSRTADEEAGTRATRQTTNRNGG